MNRTYSELIKLPTFEERFRYLKLDGVVGDSTFGFDRYLNQTFYRMPEWRRIRNEVILRDQGCDLGLEDRPIPRGARVIVHHMNPIRTEDLVNKLDWVLDPEFLICTMKVTHDAIHYGDESILYMNPIERKPNDTTPWR